MNMSSFGGDSPLPGIWAPPSFSPWTINNKGSGSGVRIGHKLVTPRSRGVTRVTKTASECGRIKVIFSLRRIYDFVCMKGSSFVPDLAFTPCNASYHGIREFLRIGFEVWERLQSARRIRRSEKLNLARYGTFMCAWNFFVANLPSQHRQRRLWMGYTPLPLPDAVTYWLLDALIKQVFSLFLALLVPNGQGGLVTMFIIVTRMQWSEYRIYLGTLMFLLALNWKAEVILIQVWSE